MVNRSSFRALLVLVGVFAGGAGTGAAASLAWFHHRTVHLLEHGGSPHNDLRMRALQRALNLSPEQRTSVAAILERQAPERRRLMGEMMQKCGDPVRAYKAKADAEIRAVLNPDQQIQFDKLAKRQAERFFQGPPPDSSAH
jgi:Spy/CpxP family protein refolding chaperone